MSNRRVGSGDCSAQTIGAQGSDDESQESMKFCSAQTIGVQGSEEKAQKSMHFCTKKTSGCVLLLFISVLVGISKMSNSGLQSQSYDHPPWLESCAFIYLDVGSNVGVQVRKFYEPERYVGAPVLQYFDRNFGDATFRRTSSRVCALGMEPNPLRRGRLDEITRNYSRNGWKVHFYPFAAWTQGGVKCFLNIGKYSNHGAKLKNTWIPSWGCSAGAYVPVPTIDLAHFIKSLPTPVTQMKMDIEGAEFSVVPHLKRQDILCITRVRAMYIEVHGKKLSDLLPKTDALCSNGKATVVESMDDETYLWDNGQP